MDEDLARKFGHLIDRHTPGSAGRLVASTNRIEHLAKQIVGAERFTASEFCQKVPEIDRKIKFRIALPPQRQSLNIMGGTLYAELVKVIDLLFEPYAHCVLMGQCESIWIDDRPSLAPEMAGMVRDCMEKDAGSYFELAATTTPLDEYACIAPLSDRAADMLFASFGLAHLLPSIHAMQSLDIEVSRLLAGCLQPGTMTIPKMIGEAFHHYAFRTNHQTWYVAAPGGVSNAGLLARAITIAEPLLDKRIDLSPYLAQFREKVYAFMRSRTAENVWLNFDENLAGTTD